VNMAEVVLFHHAQGLTPGVNAFAEELRGAGHAVHTPDLFEGRTFDTVEEGVSYAEELGFDEVTERGVRAVDGLPAELVYAGFSLGVLPGPEAGADAAGSARGPAVPLLRPGVGVRLHLARRGAGAGACDERRPVLRRRGQRRGAGAR